MLSMHTTIRDNKEEEEEEEEEEKKNHSIFLIF